MIDDVKSDHCPKTTPVTIESAQRFIRSWVIDSIQFELLFTSIYAS